MRRLFTHPSRRRRAGTFIFGIVSIALWCEFLVYYFVIFRCSWPTLRGVNDAKILKAFFIADTHLLGPIRGHWFDKLRREWQMQRAFQTAVAVHRPDAVFFLGDLFDEGHWVDSSEFSDYVSRFNTLFQVPKDVSVFIVPGNHDMGFHYELSPGLNSRFNQAFNTTSVKLLNIKGSSFVLVNSMAMQKDGCFLCHAAELRLRNFGEKLECEKDPGSSEKCKRYKQISSYSKPILLQHFPMYRESDVNCTEHDSAPFDEKVKPFRQTWDCLSKESSVFLLDTLKPRLILSGHTHHGCLVHHELQLDKSVIPEHSVPSFSWRNRNNPSFIMGQISPEEYALSKCYMPEENSVIHTYIIGAIIGIVYFSIVFIVPCLRRINLRGKKKT